MPKLESNVVDALNAQLGREFAASSQYLAMAIYFADQSLDQLARFFYDQSIEEREHGMKFAHYLLETDEVPVIPAIPEPQAEFGSAEQVAEISLEMEQEVTRHIHELVDLARSEGDHTTDNFLQWFVEEQLEEENTFHTLLDVIRQAGDNLLLVEEFIRRRHPVGA